MYILTGVLKILNCILSRFAPTIFNVKVPQRKLGLASIFLFPPKCWVVRC
jgi:hypothetical protein